MTIVANTPVRARPLYRDTIDWPRLYAEGFRVDLGGGALVEAVGLLAPFTDTRECIVLLVPCPKALTAQVSEALVHGAALARATGGLWEWLTRIRGAAP